MKSHNICAEKPFLYWEMEFTSLLGGGIESESIPFGNIQKTLLNLWMAEITEEDLFLMRSKWLEVPIVGGGCSGPLVIIYCLNILESIIIK